MYNYTLTVADYGEVYVHSELSVDTKAEQLRAVLDDIRKHSSETFEKMLENGIHITNVECTLDPRVLKVGDEVTIVERVYPFYESPTRENGQILYAPDGRVESAWAKVVEPMNQGWLKIEYLETGLEAWIYQHDVLYAGRC